MARNRLEVPGAREALDKLKMEVASEIGFSDYAHMDKADLPARENGRVGGHMVQRLIEIAESQLSGK